jgi:hypothetical protein
MPIDGVVRQTSEGMVMQCSCSQRCFIENGSVQVGSQRICLLSVNHGDRCRAWETDGYKWLIDSEPSKIKQLP